MRPFFAVFEGLSHEAIYLFKRLDGLPMDFPAFLAAALFGRVIEATQAVALLTWHGFSQDASISLRTALEALFRLRLSISKPDWAKTLANADLLERIKMYSLVVDGFFGDLPEDERADFARRRDALQELKRELNPQRLKIEELARETGLQLLYQTIYRSTSSYVHLSLRALGEYMVEDPGGFYSGLHFGPSGQRADFHIFGASELLRLAVETVLTRFRVQPRDELTSVLASFYKLRPIGVQEAADDR